MKTPSAVRILRPKHWVKNALLFLPALAVHTGLDRPQLYVGFLAFCAAASAGYVLNDILDLEADRRHAHRSTRVLAAGDMEAPAAFLLALAAIIIAIIAASPLPEHFQLVLLTYLILNVSYSALFKRVELMDVLLLAGMYFMRLIAGAILANVPLSRPLLAFSTFFFLSLASCKRAMEHKEDRQLMVSLGAGAAMSATLVYCLYITGEHVRQSYSRPELLWVGVPILLLWLSRLWLWVARERLREDPIVFAATDPASIGLALIFGAVTFLAI